MLTHSLVLLALLLLYCCFTAALLQVGCNYKWTLQLYEALDKGTSSSSSSKVAVPKFQSGIYKYTGSKAAVKQQ
jgi:hypothetical protein